MVAWGSQGQTSLAEPRGSLGTEAAFREALTQGFDALELCDRNLLRFHYFHDLTVDQLAAMFSTPRAQMIRQLARIHDRLLREIRRGLALRLALGRDELDRLIDLARGRLDLAIARMLRR